jgi:uncharacterized membrane protein
METVSIFIFIIVAILNVILFFKIWGMTNNIKDLKHLYMHDKGITEKEIREEGRYLGIGYVDKEDKRILIK